MYLIQMIQISLVIVGLCKIVTVSGGYSGGYLSYDSDNGLIGGHLNCNTSATISCKFSVNTPLITWRIAQTIEDSSPLAAQCYLFSCLVNPKFLTNYKFTYNQSTGVTNVTIKAVTFEHANLEFRCDDGSQPKPFKPSVAVPPEQHLTEISNNTMEDYTELSIHTPCIYPTDSVNITWYSKTMNGTNRKRENESKRTVRPCTTSSVCIMAKKSSRIESILHIPKHKDGRRRKRRSTGSVQERTFEVLVEHASGSFVIGVGNYSVTEENVNNAISDSTGCFSETGRCTIGLAIGLSLIFVLLVVFIICMRMRKSVDGCSNSPTGLRLISKTETLATFTWTPEPNQEGQNKFRLCYKKLDDKTSTFKEIKVNGTKETIKDLQPGCMYQCYVYKMTGNRKSDNSKPIDFTTLGLPDSPTKFEIIEVTENSFLLHWTPGFYRKYGQTFVLEYKDTKTGKPRVINIEEKTAASIPFKYLLDSLSPGTEYQLMLYAENKLGSSSRIGPIIQTTLGFPDEPTHLQTVPDTVTETTVTLTWKPGKYRKYRQTFVVSYRLKDEKNLRWTDLLAQDEPKPTILNKVVDLKEGKTYEFKIYAKNGIGVSKTSNIISVETKGKPESPCELAEVESERTSKSITVSWIPGTYRRDTQKFVLNYARASNGRNLTWKHNVLVDDGHSPEIKVKIGGLRAGQSYHIAIYAINHTGRTSEMSNTITVKTEELLPQPPAEFVCCNIVETKVQLSWKPVIYQQKQSFYLTYSSEKDQWSEVVPFDNNHEKVEHIVSNLTPGTVYEFSVWSFFGNFNDGKISERCEIQWIKTKDKSTDTES